MAEKEEEKKNIKVEGQQPEANQSSEKKTEEKAEKKEEKTSDKAEDKKADAKDAEKKEEKQEDPLEKANKEIADLKDKYLRTLAEFDNYKKRTLKEKAELILNEIGRASCRERV